MKNLLMALVTIVLAACGSEPTAPDVEPTHALESDLIDGRKFLSRPRDVVIYHDTLP